MGDLGNLFSPVSNKERESFGFAGTGRADDIAVEGVGGIDEGRGDWGRGILEGKREGKYIYVCISI